MSNVIQFPVNDREPTAEEVAEAHKFCKNLLQEISEDESYIGFVLVGIKQNYNVDIISSRDDKEAVEWLLSVASENLLELENEAHE